MESTMSSGSEKISAKDTLIIERVEDASILSDFVCGVDEMDDFIHHALDAHIQTSGEDYKYYIVKIRDVIVAFFSTKPNSFFLNKENVEDKLFGDLAMPVIASSDPDDYFKYPFFESIEIEYLAVRKEYRNKEIGRTIVAVLSEKYKNQYEWMTVLAFQGNDYSAVGFYKKCGFEPMESEDSVKDKDNRKMCKVLNPIIP